MKRPKGIGARSIVIPLLTAIAVAFLIAGLVPRNHKGEAGLLGVVTILLGAGVVAACAIWTLNLNRTRVPRTAEHGPFGRLLSALHHARPSQAARSVEIWASPTRGAVATTSRRVRLRRIIAAYTVNRLGTWFGFVALSVAVFDHTHSAIAVAALLISGQALPAFVAPALAARVETTRRRGVLSGLYLFEGIVTTLLAVLLWHFWLPAILVLAALDGTAAQAASALLRSETACAAREQAEVDWHSGQGMDLEASRQAAERQANATLNIAFSATFMLGPAIAGGVIAAAGASAALFIDAGSFLICGAMLLDLYLQTGKSGETSAGARVLAASQYVNSVPALRVLLLAEAIALVFFDSGGPIEIAYAKTSLHAGPGGYGLLLGTWGVGVVLGSLIFARSPKRGLGAMLTAGTLAMGLAYIGFSVAPSLASACIAAVIGGVGNGVEWASVISIVQRLTPPDLHGRLINLVESVGALALALGLSLGGALVALSSPREAFLVVGIGAAVMTLPFLRLTMRGIDRVTATDAQITDEPLEDSRVASPPKLGYETLKEPRELAYIR
jgi:Major Facilitator Superfamily